MGPSKALGFDGYPPFFFQYYWSIVKEDVYEFALGVLNKGLPLDCSNVIDIVLIPKLPNPTNLKIFRLSVFVLFHTNWWLRL